MVNVHRVGPEGIAKVRSRALSKIAELRESLEAEEALVHKAMHPDLRRVLLWQQLDTGFPDPGLIDEVREGFELVGPSTVSGAFFKRYKAPQQTVEQLRSQCAWRKKATISKCRPTSNSDPDLELWKLTLEEVEQGWISGPFWSESEVSESLSTDQWLCTRRFPVIQGPKVRVIDDCLQSGVNSAYTAFNKLKLMDADAFISWVLLILQASANPRSYLVLESGERVYVRKHHAWGKGLGLLGKTLDLASKLSSTVSWLPGPPELQQPAFFISTALMFGATSSVYSFNRCSASLWHLLTSLGSVCCTVFFDDFPCLEPRASAESADHFMPRRISHSLRPSLYLGFRYLWKSPMLAPSQSGISLTACLS